MKTAKSLILKGVTSYWQKTWDTSQDGHHLKIFQPQVNLKPSHLFITNRSEQLTIHHLRLGRSKLNGHDPIDKKELKEKLCSNCNEVEDTSHFLLKCSIFSAPRRLLFLHIEDVYNTYNIPMKHRIYDELILGDNPSIPKNARDKILQYVIEFINKTKRFK